MLSPQDPYRDDRWSARCDGCLAPAPEPWVREGTRDEVLAALILEGWEDRPPSMIWCVACSRKAREVPFPLGRRGAARKRR